MKTTTTRSALAEACAAVKGLVAKDSLNPFSRVRLDAAGPNLSLTGSDGDMQVEYRVKGDDGPQIEYRVKGDDGPGTEAGGHDSGALALPGVLFCRFVEAMPAGIVEIGGEADKWAKIAGSEGVTYRLAAGDATAYRIMAGPEAGCARIDIGAVLMKEMLRKVKFAAASDDTRKALNGVNVKFAGGKLEMTATDGRRLAHVEKDLDEHSSSITDARRDGRAARDESFEITLPNKAVALVYGLLGDECGPVRLQADGKAARFTAAKWSLTTKVLADKYPAWRNVIPGNPEHKAEVGRVVFLEALKRAALAAGEDKAVRVSLRDGAATFEARGNLSEAKTTVEKCKIGDESNESFLFNPRLLKDALEAIDEDEFEMGFGWGGAFGPVVLKCAIPWVAAVMPMQESEVE